MLYTVCVVYVTHIIIIHVDEQFYYNGEWTQDSRGFLFLAGNSVEYEPVKNVN